MPYGAYSYGAAAFGAAEDIGSRGIEEAINDALLGTVRDLDMFDASQKAWPNKNFDPVIGVAYLRVENIANGNERIFVTSRAPHRYIGILQLTVVGPLNEGPTYAQDLATDVAASYPADMMIRSSGINIRIEKSPDVLQAFRTDKTWNVVVSIRYEAFPVNRY